MYVFLCESDHLENRRNTVMATDLGIAEELNLSSQKNISASCSCGPGEGEEIWGRQQHGPTHDKVSRAVLTW